MQLETTSLRRQAGTPEPQNGPELTVIAPSFNEADNVVPLIEKLTDALDGVHWEVIFVDDNSPDGTSDRVREQARLNSRVRCVQRLGRRGLTSACAEAVLTSSAPYVAIIDADLQHDETLLPKMLAVLRSGEAEVVIGSRYTEKKLSEGFTRFRQATSFIATRLAQTILRAELTDPVSGFFMAKREVFEGSIRNLSGIGNKILVDIFASSNRRLKFRDLPYTFRARLHGESKLDTLTVWEYLVLLADKVFGRFIPVRLILFSLVGASGVIVHFTVFWTALLSGLAASYSPDHAIQFKVAQGSGDARGGIVELLLEQYPDLSRQAVARVGNTDRPPLVPGDQQHRRGCERRLRRADLGVVPGSRAPRQICAELCGTVRHRREHDFELLGERHLHLAEKVDLGGGGGVLCLAYFRQCDEDPLILSFSPRGEGTPELSAAEVIQSPLLPLGRETE